MSQRPPFTDHFYCPVKHIPALERCDSWREVAEIALQVLEEMATIHDDVPIHQVCGPITTGPGTIDEKLRIFEEAIIYNRKRGLVVFNQLPTEIALGRLWRKWKEQIQDETAYCWELLHEVYAPIFRSGHVKTLIFMPGWEASTGTRWEHEQAKRLGLKTEFMPISWNWRQE